MPPLLVTVSLFICHFAIARCAPSIVFPKDEDDKSPSNVNEKLTECLADEFKIEFKGECRPLLHPDPNICPGGQWLVLDFSSASLPNPQIRGKCAPQRCPSLQHFWVDQKKCVYENQSASLCPSGNMLGTDYFGDGFCDCVRNPVHIKDQKSGVCYPAFERRPCSKDRVWVVGGCHLDNCTETRGRFPNKTIVSWSDGKCYAVNEQGPCPQGNDVSINANSKSPECVDRLTSLHLVDPPCSGTDHSGKCTQPVMSPQSVFYSQVAAQANKKRN